MGRFIPDGSRSAEILFAVYAMFYDLVNKPAVDRYGKLDDTAFAEDDLQIANTLLDTLERLYPLRPGRNVNPTTCGVQTEKMLNDYVQMKHWQRMLNAIYGEKGEGT